MIAYILALLRLIGRVKTCCSIYFKQSVNESRHIGVCRLEAKGYNLSRCKLDVKAKHVHKRNLKNTNGSRVLLHPRKSDAARNHQSACTCIHISIRCKDPCYRIPVCINVCIPFFVFFLCCI